MRKSLLTALVASVGVVFLLGPVAAQEAETDYVRVASWDVKRSQWGAYVENFEKTTQPVLEKLFAEGVITEWGIGANVVHTEDGYTHQTWWAGKTLASLEAVLDAFNEGVSEDERRSRASRLADAITNHSDSIRRSLVIKTRPNQVDEGYIFSSRNKVLPGKGADWLELWKLYFQPTYDKLLEEGTILAYGIDVDYIHTEDPRYRSVWHVVANLEAQGKFVAAIRATFQGRSDAENEAFFAAMAGVSDRAEHRDSMTRIIHYAVK